VTVIAAAGSQTLWYLTRGSGVVALLLLTATALLGSLSATRWRSERWPRFAVAELHRNLTLLALVFIATHVLTTVTDGYAPIGLRDAVVPFASRYRPLWLGFGALALDLLLALTVTSLLRRRIGYRAWRVLHWAAYGAWPLAFVHGFGSGTDARFGWLVVLTLACGVAVVAAITWRLVQSRSPRLQLGAGVATVAAAAVLVAWYESGPAQRGWARRAGTPAALLATARATPRQLASRARRAAASRSAPLTRIEGPLIGHISQSGPDANGDAAVAIAAAVRGPTQGVLRLTLWGIALGGGGIAMNDSRVSFQPASGGQIASGRVVGLDGSHVLASVATPTGRKMLLSLVLRIDPVAATVTGTARGSVVTAGEEQQ
jgi:sulfoxide reductase heme-binding subunit YedZ